MLPDFKRAKAVMCIHLDEFVKRRKKFHDPAFRDIPVRIIHEGTGMTTVNADSDFQHDMEMKPIHASATTTYDELISDPSLVYKVLDDLSRQMIEEQSRIMVEAVSEVTERTGQVSNRKGEVTPENILEMFSKMLISFNGNGQVNMPAIHAGPHMIPEIKVALKKLQNMPEYAQQLDELLIRKKQEWDDRENNRKLVG